MRKVLVIERVLLQNVEYCQPQKNGRHVFSVMLRQTGGSGVVWFQKVGDFMEM